MKKKVEGTMASELYTAEAAESNKRAKLEQVIPDPPEGEAEKAIAEAEERLR